LHEAACGAIRERDLAAVAADHGARDAALVSRVVVPREERYLESRFGQQYSGYRDSVRRWF
jgi:protein-S-isoprenylcysteine O-methyltransferase Ste14